MIPSGRDFNAEKDFFSFFSPSCRATSAAVRAAFMMQRGPDSDLFDAALEWRDHAQTMRQLTSADGASLERLPQRFRIALRFIDATPRHLESSVV